MEASFKGPLFIVGMPRSGTKLLRAMLNAHTAVAILEIETEFLPYWVANWNSFGDLSDEAAFRRFHAANSNLPFFVYQRERGAEVDARAWYGACREFSPAGVFEGLARSTLGVDADQPVIWGDKSPSYIRHIGLLARLYPDARFIHIVRDVRDYCLSIRKAWSKNMLRAAQRWNDDVAQARADGRRQGDRYLELRYEDLLEEPENTIARACAFLAVPFSPDLLTLARPTENLGDAKGAQGIVRTNLHKYKDRMDRKTLAKINRIAGGTLRDAGYECEYDGPPSRIAPLRMRYYQLLDGANLILSTARERGVAGALTFVWSYFVVSGNRQTADR